MPTIDGSLAKPFKEVSKIQKIFIPVLISAIVLGVISGYYLSAKSSANSTAPISEDQAKLPQQDSRTFRDFAEGVIKPRPVSKNLEEYVEGTHYLQRDNNQHPVALTSSVVDLSKYEGKKVKVFGETQKAIKEGWLMDVGKVEELK